MQERTSFFSQGVRLAANLWMPSGAKPRSALLVTGALTTVKEQMPATYASRLAEAGFAAMTFDFRGFGESEGALREVESAASKAEDIRNAAAFLRAHPAVDGERLGALAVCASAGYVTLAALGSTPLRSLVFVAPWLHDAELVEQVYGGTVGVAGRLARAAAARERYARTGLIEYVRAASNVDATAAMYAPGDALDYYLNPARGAIPAWGGRFAVMAWKEWLELDPISLAPHLGVPLRIITSERTATPAGTKRFEARLRARHDTIWLDADPFAFYDDPKTVTTTLAHAVAHFQATLV